MAVLISSSIVSSLQPGNFTHSHGVASEMTGPAPGAPTLFSTTSSLRYLSIPVLADNLSVIAPFWNYMFLILAIIAGSMLVLMFVRLRQALKAADLAAAELERVRREAQQLKEDRKSLEHELESFAYSVSHDLRAPLRSVHGYSKILQEDYSKQMDGEGAKTLQVIVGNAEKMGRLIDDLVQYSRLGRKEMVKTEVQMTSLVQSIVNDTLAREAHANRVIDVAIDTLQPVHADSEMMKQVWFNLISNAVKYTGKNDRARIEITSEIRDHEICYRIRDNGVGFEMKYADKLFGMFQRLHKVHEFEGDGVGLAVVKRIVARHHGKVWAEGKINDGAIFYFTIPTHNGKQ